MKKRIVNKLALLNELVENTELQLTEVKDLYLLQPEDMLNRPAANGGWSIAQCLAHLNTYAGYYLPKIAKTLGDCVITDGSHQISWLGSYFVNMMKSTNVRKYKAVRRHLPQSNLNAQEVVQEFVANQQLLLQYLTKAKKADLNAGKIPTSIFPLLKLNLGDVLHFLVVHNQRHLLQAKRNYRSQDYAKSFVIT